MRLTEQLYRLVNFDPEQKNFFRCTVHDEECECLFGRGTHATFILNHVEKAGPESSFAVMCKDYGDYYLATRQTFATHDDAEKYAATIAPSRMPIVVEGRWFQMRAPKIETPSGSEASEK